MNLGLDSRPQSPASSFSSLACCLRSRSASFSGSNRPVRSKKQRGSAMALKVARHYTDCGNMRG